MPVFPLPPGLVARLNIPPPYKHAIEATAPPAYLPPQHRISTFRPESIPLPPSPAPSPPTPQPPPPDYSPSVYSQHQRLSHYVPNPNPNPNPDPADFGFPSSPRRPSASKVEHPSHFKESWSDLSMQADLEAQPGGNEIAKAKAKAVDGGKSIFRLYPPVGEGEVERLYWKRAVVALAVSLLVVVVVVVAVCASLDGGRS